MWTETSLGDWRTASLTTSLVRRRASSATSSQCQRLSIVATNRRARPTASGVAGNRRSAELMSCAPSLLVARLLGLTDWQLDGVECSRNAVLDLTAAFELGVELRAEKDREVRDPQPYKKGHDRTEGAVRLVVRPEVGDVEPEPERCHYPHEHSNEGPGAQPTEAVHAHVRGCVVEEGDAGDDDEREHRPLGDSPRGDCGAAEPDLVADSLGDTPSDHDRDGDQGRDEHDAERDRHLQGPELPEAAPFLDAVDGVGSSHERAHIRRRRPQRAQQADTEQRGGASLAAHHALDRLAQSVDGGLRTQSIDDVEER